PWCGVSSTCRPRPSSTSGWRRMRLRGRDCSPAPPARCWLALNGFLWNNATMIPLDVLDAVTIPISCPVSWDEMQGDHRTRFCDQCSQNVYDVSELSRAEAIELV